MSNMFPGGQRGGISLVLAGLLVGLGIAFAGLSIADALFASRASDRYVSVKGFSEQDVAADLAIWPVTFTVEGDELSELQDTVETVRRTVRTFLREAGFEDGELSDSSPNITDFHAQAYQQNRPQFRYQATATVTVRTPKVEGVKETEARSGDLVRAGVKLQVGYGGAVQYFFTALNRIKPEMIAEATRNAREAADQFAADSGSQVGAIRQARQGLFSINNRDQFTPEIKKVRVVTSVDYFLIDE